MKDPHDFPASHWVTLIRSEYREMPDLHLTPAQMQRLWGLGPDTCAEVVDALLAEQAVRLTLAGAYAAIRSRPRARNVGAVPAAPTSSTLRTEA